LVGVLGDTGKVAIIKIGNEVFIVAQGEMIQNRIRVDLVDADAGLVVLIEDGERVELRFG
jgi:transketolase C-terminal domain/subunit